MRIGIVTTWFERGAGYVSKLYRSALEQQNEVYIYARGGLKSDQPEWNDERVTYGLFLPYTYINKRHIFSWIEKNNLQVLFFNEQREFSIVAEIKKKYPNIKLGSYIDYYKEDTVSLFNIYDFVICNTHRHMQAMRRHKQAFYVKWGTDINLYKPNQEKHNQLTFFHSMGMSFRKGTGKVINAFINGKVYKKAKLVIHTQLSVDKISQYSEEELRDYNIEVISKTVTAPGLYYMGDIYVYPTDLDGLGLTIYEALASGLPVITTNNAPMNEVVDDEINGKLVDVEEFHSRSDGYYWPLSLCEEKSLISSMQYYIDNLKYLEKFKKQARDYAVHELNLEERFKTINEIFEDSINYNFDDKLYKQIIAKERKEKKMSLLAAVSSASRTFSFLWSKIK